MPFAQSRMPAVFFGHGNPMNALSKNSYTDAWRHIGMTIPRPKAILSISAHWYTSQTAVTVMKKPRTIHDFGGFPQELYEVEYPAPGDPALANSVQDMLATISLGLDTQWGLDHGTWAVLCHVFPKADIPIIQLSIDATQPASFHYKIGQRLVPLRDQGVFIVGSGNLVHNLHAYAWGGHAVIPYDWAVRFEKRARELLLSSDDNPLIAYEKLGSDAKLSVPTPDHYLPLLYIIGLRKEDDRISFPVEGIDGGSVSMLAVQLG
jgi:4,5-DOPA dioxygenase extradiol